MEKVFAIPCPPFDVQLSHWDRLFPPTHSKRILCFELPPAADKTRITGYLHAAFHHTVQRVPFLAGSIVPFSPDQGGRPWLRNMVPQGAARLVVKDLSNELSFSELAKANFAQHLLDTEKLCPLPKTAYVQEEPVDVCQFQANFVDGGLLLVVSIIHIAADGRGVTEIIKIFAEQLRTAQSTPDVTEPLVTRDTVYRSDRTALVSGNGVPGAIENHEAWTSSPINSHGQIAGVKNSCQMLRITAKGLARLKRITAEPSHGPDDWVSTNDAISALIWRSIMVARSRAGILPADATAYVSQPLDCRAHLGLPQPYFGNVLYMTKSSMPLDVLSNTETGLAAAARILRAQIKGMTAEKFRDLVGFAERTALDSHTRMNIIEDLPTGGIILTSHFKFALHELDFGPSFANSGDGHMSALRLPAGGTMAGAVIVMPRLPDGSCEFMVTEKDATIAALLEDEFFKQFTQDEDAVAVQVKQDSPLPLEAVPLHHEKEPFVTEIRPVSPESDGNTDDVKVGQTIVVNNVKAAHTGTIRVIHLQRPKAKNAISRQMLQELSWEIEDIHSEKSGTRALIIASAVDDVFCAGADLKERKTMSPSETQGFLAAMRVTFSRLEALPIPTIACVSGAALGGGLELALCCHLRVFSSNAVVGLPETRLGIIPGAGGTYRLPKVVGLSFAHDLILTGRRVQANEAYTRGLCTRLIAADESGASLSPEQKRILALDASIALAQEIASGGPVAIRAAVSSLSYSCETIENASYEVVLRTKDRNEALQAFEEKRKPVFIGQ
ncbi:putative enoyl-CoA hydratase/isomerase family protein [Ustulina deusta]|nr:putative enoyl-CoA hydratase/isomerase family protein [Ustulina deusta]